MKYLGKILITACLAFAFLALSAAGAKAQITVTTEELYSAVTWVGPGDEDVGILMLVIANSTGTNHWLKRVTVTSECDIVSDVAEVKFYREWNGTDGFQTADKLMGRGFFSPTTHTVTFDWTNVIPADTLLLTPGEPGPGDSFYVVFDVQDGLVTDSSGRLLDVVIATNDIWAWDGTDDWTAPATPQGAGIAAQILVDGYPPDFALDNIDLLTTDCAFKLNSAYACTVWDVIDNADIPGETPTVKVDLKVLGGSDSQTMTYNLGPPGVNYYNFEGTVPDEDIPDGMDIPDNWDIPAGYVIKVTATDYFGNSRSREVTQVYKYLDTIWPELESDEITMELVYDLGGDGVASIGDSVKITVNMLNQPPYNNPEEILNTLWGANYDGVFIMDYLDLNGFDPFNLMTYPIFLVDDPIDEVWEVTFALVPGNLDVDADDPLSVCSLTTEDNAGHSPGCTPPTEDIMVGDIGNRHKVVSTEAPFPIDIFGPMWGGTYYDLDTGGDDVSCPGEINIGNRIRIWIDLSMNTDSVINVTVDLLNSELGGMENASLYDDGTNGDDVADDGIYTLEWTIPYPATGGTDVGPGSHYVTISFCDNGGNCASVDVYTGRAVDTEAPDPVENLTAMAYPGGVIHLEWDDPSATTDEYEYHIYSDGGTGTIDYETEVGHRYHPDTSWSSSAMTHGTTYCFGIRVEDNACNMDTNFWVMACATADAEPPTASFINPVDGERFCDAVQVVVQSPDVDIDKFKIWYRQKDIDPGTEGDQPGPWTFGVIIENDGAFGTGIWDPTGFISDGEFEGVVCGIDLAGNEQDTTEAYDAGQTVWMVWDTTPPIVYISSVNGEDPSGVTLINGVNEICIYAVDNSADNMMVWMEVYDGIKRDTLKEGWVAKEDISPSNPFCFEFSLANWHEDNATLNVWVFDTDSTCNKGVATLTRPVQDIFPVVARMTRPVNFERVMWTTTFMVQAEFLAGSPVDEVTLVQFQEREHGTEDWTTFCSDYSPSGNFFDCIWDNTSYSHGDQVDVRALFFDNALPANVETTAFVTVTIDEFGPIVDLKIENAVDVDGVQKLGGTELSLIVEYLHDSTEVDIDSVIFWYKSCDASELYWYRLGYGTALYGSYLFPAGWSGYIGGWSAGCYEVKVVPWDASGNEGTADIDTFWYVKEAPQVAIYQVETGGLTFVNPSGHLMGSGKIYAQAGQDICFWHLIMTPEDSGVVDFVRYNYNDHNLGDAGLNESICFNPMAEGIINQADLETYGFFFDVVEVTLYDILGNHTHDYTCTLGVLDVTGNEVVITSPGYNYVCDEVYLTAAAVNAYNLESVTYYYRAVGETEWIEIGTSTGSSFYFYWHTRNNVADGWYELAATSKDKYGNISDFSRIRTLMVLNTPPIVWMNAPENGAVVGPYMNINDDGDDVRLEAFGKGPYPDAPIPAWIEFYASPLTSSTEYEIGEDGITTVGDSLFSAMWSVSTGWSGWYQVYAVAWDSAWGCYLGYSDTVEVCVDKVAPFCEIVAINSEHNVDDGMDIGGPPYEDTLKARAFETEDLNEDCFAGLDSLQFMVYNGEDCEGSLVFFGSVYEPDPSTQYEMIWNNSGLAPGDYCLKVRAVDKVGNARTSDGIWLRIEDHSQKIATIRAFHDYSIVASVTGSVDNVTIQYAPVGSDNWVSVGITENITDYLWSADWDPSSVAEGHYLARALAHGLWGTSTGPVVRFHVDADGNVHPAETEDIGSISFRAVLETGTRGVVKVEAQSMPYLLAVYSHGDVEVERISLSKETGTNMYNGTFDIPWSSSTGGDVRFYASVVPETTWIEMGGFDITEVDQYLGTSGPVEFVDGSASIDIPGGAIHVSKLNLVGYPTMTPPVVANECKKYTPIGNADGLIWKYYLFGYSADANLYDYAKITLYYDETQVTVPESELQVARWDYEDYCWEFWGVESPTIDEANNSITFWTDHLGTFAVVQTPVAMWASVEVDPNCSDYSNSMPVFVSYIQSEYADIDMYSIEVKLGPVGGNMKTIYWDDTFADGYCSPFANYHYSEYQWQCLGSGWDPISGELDIEIKDPIKALVAGDYVIFVEAYDEVGNYASAVDTFTVDVKVPKITFLNGYVGKNPEFSFTIEDAESGVDTNSIYVDMYSVTKLLSEGGSWVENRRYLGTYTPPQIDIVAGMVHITTTLDLVNKQAFDVVIYDGTYENGGAPAEQDEMRIYLPGHGPGDCVGNQADPVYQRFAIDAEGPEVTATSMDARPIVFSINDDAGIDWTTFMIMEDGTDITDEDRVVIDQEAGTVTYTPTAIGAGVTIKVQDMVGNKSTCEFTTEAKELAISDAHNYPNPFDQSTTIAFTLSRGGDVVMKIYDFAGELVKTIIPGDYMDAGEVTASWFGKNDDGEDVANGIYLCHIKVNDGSNTASEVVKIAVVRKD